MVLRGYCGTLRSARRLRLVKRRKNLSRFLKEVQMSYVKPAILVLAALAMSAPSIVQAQGYTQRGTRRGALAGAVIGGLIGADRGEALAGAAIGGVIGGVTGRAIGSSRDARYWNGGYGQGHYQQTRYDRGGYGNGFGVQYAPVTRVYRSSYYGGGGYGGGGYYGGRGCPNGGW